MPSRLPPDPDGLPALERVKSSNVYAIGYDERSQFLFVRFRSAESDSPSPGMLYRYSKVPVGVWMRFQKARSKGHFLAVHIKGTYWYMRWTGKTWRPETALRQDSSRRKRAKELSRRLQDFWTNR